MESRSISLKKPSEMPLRIRLIPPLTLILGTVIYRMGWNITSDGALGDVFWWLVIGGAVTGTYFSIRLLSRPIPMNKVNSFEFRLPVILGVSISLIVGSVYLYQQIPATIAVISKVVLGTAVTANIGGYLFLVLLIKPELSSGIKSRLLRVAMSTIVTIGLVSLTIHTIRFLSSPEAILIQSKVMAILLLAALITVYPLVLECIWRVWREREASYPRWLPR
jgi:hypothetical protein